MDAQNTHMHMGTKEGDLFCTHVIEDPRWSALLNNKVHIQYFITMLLFIRC